MPKMQVNLSNDDNEPKAQSTSSEYSNLRHKQAVLLLGNKCSVCRCEELDKLQIDHKEQIFLSNDERKRQGEAGIKLYNGLLKGTKDKDKYQLLCKDCHKKKTMDNMEYMNPVKRSIMHPEYEDDNE